MNIKQYLSNVNRELLEWRKSREFKNYKYSKLILMLPNLLQALHNISISIVVSQKSREKSIATLDYIESGFDLIPEALIGPLGYKDDIFISAKILISILNEDNHSAAIIESEVDIAMLNEIIEESKNMLGDHIHHKALNVINSF